MRIKELAERTNLLDKTIRYYESIDLLPPPRRLPNGYRDYDAADVQRVKFVAGARLLGFSLDDIGEVLALRDQREAPCRTVLSLLQQNPASRNSWGERGANFRQGAPARRHGPRLRCGYWLLVFSGCAGCGF